jgi:hypothetical protein
MLEASRKEPLLTIKLSEARQLCTKPELALIVSASAKALAETTVARLDKMIERARKLRDKYAGLATTQHRKTQATKSARGVGDANVRTKRKAEIFGALLEKFSARKTLLEERQRKAKEAAAKKAAKAANKALPKATKKAASKPATKRLSTGKASKKTALKKAAVKKVTQKKPVAKKPKTRAVTPGGQSTAVSKATKIVQRTRGKAISAHIKSRGKRDQARRDAKGR